MYRIIVSYTAFRGAIHYPYYYSSTFLNHHSQLTHSLTASQPPLTHHPYSVSVPPQFKFNRYFIPLNHYCRYDNNIPSEDAIDELFFNIFMMASAVPGVNVSTVKLCKVLFICMLPLPPPSLGCPTSTST